MKEVSCLRRTWVDLSLLIVLEMSYSSPGAMFCSVLLL